MSDRRATRILINKDWATPVYVYKSGDGPPLSIWNTAQIILRFNDITKCEIRRFGNMDMNLQPEIIDLKSRDLTVLLLGAVPHDLIKRLSDILNVKVDWG